MRLRDERGSVLVEYTIVLCLVAVGAVGALAACGVLLLRFFIYQQALLLLPFP